MNATAMRLSVLSCGCAALGLWGSLTLAHETVTTPAIKIAVFDFELEDLSAAAVILGEKTTSSASLDKATHAVRAELTKSGRYVVIDPGHDAPLASQLGADQSLIGVVRRVSQTDYYVLVQIRDAHTGKVLAQESANFAGGEEGWASGARMLIDHQVLTVTVVDAAPVCKTADVNPVSGQAECVDPQGAPVDPPPPREDHS
ncbi:MAG: DUF2380 domain-containing protein [Gammaproteobacteria bacterium]